MPSRLQSLDILRGLTLFMLVFFGPVISHLLQTIGAEWCNPILYQLDHEPWEGFRLWDLLMPLFLFMAGTSMPFSFEKYRDKKGREGIWFRIFRRVLLLFIIGMMVQGNLLGLDPKHIYFYTNTLQAIACGYLIAAVILLTFRQIRWQIICTIALLVVYSIPMALCGDYTPDGNFCEWLDRVVMGRFRDGVDWDENGVWHFSETYRYTWIWSSITFGATVMLGCLSGEWIRKASGKKTALGIMLTGVLLVGVALVYAHFEPVIKHIWTSSMVLLAGGFSMILLGLFHYIFDCLGVSRGVTFLKVYGMNSIVAYFLGETVNFRSVVNSLSYGLRQYMGDFYDVWTTFGNFLIVFLILLAMYRLRIFLKV